MSIIDIEWCKRECIKNKIRTFGSNKIEAFEERVAIKIESGIDEDKARNDVFKYYTNQ